MKIRNQLLLNNGMILGVLLVVAATIHQGSVTLLLEALGEDRPSALAGTEDVLAIRVVDTGIGIPGQRREAIFEDFQQVDGSISRKYGGADRYMFNPVDRDELLHTIEALLLSKSHRQVLERTA